MTEEAQNLSEFMVPTVVCLCRSKGKVVQDCTVYIGRVCFRGGWNLKQSKWHNHFSVKKYGLDEALSKYEEELRNNKELLEALPELAGATLGCWCKGKQPDDRCHGDILVKLFKEHVMKL